MAEESWHTAEISVEKPDSSVDYRELLSHTKAFKRSSVRLEERDGRINFRVEAHDLTALRAAVNSILRDMKIVEGSLKARIPKK